MKEGVETIYCELKVSRLAASVIAATSTATLAMVWITPLPMPVRITLSPWIVLSAFEAIQRIAWCRGPRATCALFAQSTREIAVQGVSGAWRSGVLSAGSFVAPWLTIVRWRPAGTWFDRTVLVLPGMLDDGSFRRLRVLLRWG